MNKQCICQPLSLTPTSDSTTVATSRKQKNHGILQIPRMDNLPFPKLATSPKQKYHGTRQTLRMDNYPFPELATSPKPKHSEDALA